MTCDSRLDVDSFMGSPWTEPEREQVRAWMTDNDIDPDRTFAITLGEGHVIAEQMKAFDGEMLTFEETYPVRTLPPVWHSLQNPATRTTRPLEATQPSESTTGSETEQGAPT